MATGDKAFAKGLRVVAASKDLREGYDDINARGDEIADEIDARSASDTAEAVARAAADNLKLDKANIFVQATAPANIVGTGYSGRIWVRKA